MKAVVPLVQRRRDGLRGIVLFVLDVACVLTRHAGGCGVLNECWYLFYDEPRDAFRLTVRNRVTYRLWRWASGFPLPSEVPA